MIIDCNLLKLGIFLILVGAGAWLGQKLKGSMGAALGALLGIIISSIISRQTNC